MSDKMVSPGEVLIWTNGTGSAVVSGEVVQVGTYGVGVALVDIASTAAGAVQIKGIARLPKYATTNAIEQGAPVYMILATQLCYNAYASGRVFVGYAALAAGASATTCDVLLTQLIPAGTVTRKKTLSFFDARVHDNLAALLPATAGSDDLGLVPGTLGTHSPHLKASDFGGTTATQYARFSIVIPEGYTAGAALVLGFTAGMTTSVADGACSLDVVAYKHVAADGTVSADICATAAQSINSLTIAEKTFTITPTGVVAGDVLDVRIVVAGSDTANAAVMVPEITEAALYYGATVGT